MTRRLSDIERNALGFVARQGGSFCPDDDAASEPTIIKTLKRLVNRGLLSVEVSDSAPPRFHLTSLGKQEVGNG